jgi:hypothetical protein
MDIMMYPLFKCAVNVMQLAGRNLIIIKKNYELNIK